MLLEFGFQGVYFLLPVKFLLTKGLTRLELVIFQPNGKERPTFPASVRALIA